MMKKLIAMVLAGALLGATTACSGGTTKPAETSSAAASAGSSSTAPAGGDTSGDKPVELIFTSVSVPGDSHTEAMTKFKEKCEELSGGSITVKTYHSGSLFSADNELDAIVAGDADMAYLSFPTIATQIPSYSMFASGYFFSSYEHMTSVLNGDVAKEKIYPQIQETVGVVPLGAFYLGSRVVNTRNKEINSYADMNGLLLRMPNSEAWLFLGKALGANPTPLSFNELYTALQTGAVDAQDNPLPSIESAKFYEVTKNIAITNHVVDSILPCVNQAKWDSMSDNQRKAVTEAMEYARDFNDKERQGNETRLIDFFKEKGLTITYPDIADFKKNVQAAYAADKEQTASWDMDLYNEIQALAK